MYASSFVKTGLVLFSALASITSASATPPHRDVFQFVNTTFAENIAVRSNGELLVTVVFKPELWLVNPYTNTAKLVKNFTEEGTPGSPNSLTGITEVTPDVFTLSTVFVNIDPVSLAPGSSAVWKVDFNQPSKHALAKVSLVTAAPDAGGFNGMTRLSEKDQTILSADVVEGKIYRINVRTGEHKAVLEDALTKAPNGGVGVNGLGVNGLRTYKGYLYFTSTGQKVLARVKINRDGTAAGPFEKVADVGLVDDFAIDARGNSYLCQDSSVVRVGADGKVEHIIGNLNSTVVAGPTSAQFGRRKTDKKTLYVTTNGGLFSPVNGTYIEGGKVVAIDLSGY